MKKRHCKFTTSPANGKDTVAVVVPASPSCPGQPPKFVEVAYKCRPLEFRSKIICENETIQLKCKRNARIAIYSATFGRVQFQSAQCLQPPGIDDESKIFDIFKNSVIETIVFPVPSIAQLVVPCVKNNSIKLSAQSKKYICATDSRPHLFYLSRSVNQLILMGATEFRAFVSFPGRGTIYNRLISHMLYTGSVGSFSALSSIKV